MKDKALCMYQKNPARAAEALALSASLAYFVLLLRVYLVQYHVPDFRSYGGFALNGYKAKDGFSSLFIWISGLTRILPGFLTVLCLAMLACSVFNLLYFYAACFYDGLKDYFIVLFAVLSCGCWYYFYGKVFYDFPFSVFTYSAGLHVLADAVNKRRAGMPKQREWNIFCLLMGLTLSWKPYNIFMLAGLGLLILMKDETRELFIESVHTGKTFSFSVLAFLAGYLMGNYNLLISPQETLNGIRAYRASYPFLPFLFYKNRIIWDHVGDLPFHISVCNVFSAAVFLMILPVMVKRFRYLAVSAFMLICFYIYITHFSPGYTWHGFTFGVFMITYMMFAASGNGKGHKCRREVLSLAVLLQIAVNFGINVPIQIRWHETTIEAVQTLEEKEDAIYDDVKMLAERLDGSTFTIDEAVKRYRVMPVRTLDFNRLSLQQTYVAANNMVLVNPLEYADYWSWTQLYDSPWYSNDVNNCEYVIYIIPDCFKRMGDVADIHCHDGREKYTGISGDGYSIYVYRNNS